MGDKVNVDGRRRRAHARGDGVASGASHGVKRLAIEDMEEFLRMDGAESDTNDEGDKVVTPIDVDLDEGGIGPHILINPLGATHGAGVGGGLSIEDTGLGSHGVFSNEWVEAAALVMGGGICHAGERRVDTQHASSGEHSWRHVPKADGTNVRFEVGLAMDGKAVGEELGGRGRGRELWHWNRREGRSRKGGSGRRKRRGRGRERGLRCGR